MCGGQQETSIDGTYCPAIIIITESPLIMSLQIILLINKITDKSIIKSLTIHVTKITVSIGTCACSIECEYTVHVLTCSCNCPTFTAKSSLILVVCVKCFCVLLNCSLTYK